MTNAGQTVTVTVVCKRFALGRTASAPRGDYELCTVRKQVKKGRVTVTTYGNPVKVVVHLKAPSTNGYTAYRQKKAYDAG